MERMKQSFEDTFRVPFHEVDAVGVMFFAHLFTHAHTSYERFMASLGLDLGGLSAAHDLALPIVHAHADYHAPFTPGLEATVGLRIARLGESSFTTAYAFRDPTDGALANVELVHCCIRPGSAGACALPTWLRARLEPYAG
jgi:YbgC/YbaW family acyl-CoA thioester hydrolase